MPSQITKFFNNTSGLNVTDSPLSIKDSQATGQSYNYDYATIGAISKVLSPMVLNTIADTQLKSLGMHVYHSATDDSRLPIRCAGTKIQTFNFDTAVFTNLADDTVSASTTFLDSTTSQQVVSSAFGTVDAGTALWLAGGGLTSLYGFNGTKLTANGVPLPTGLVTTSINTHDSGTFTTPGAFYYAVSYHKLSTLVLGNAALDVIATTVNADDTVTLNLSGLTNLDTTRFDKVYIYRSALNGSTAFTTGDLIAELSSLVTTYKDTGSSISSAEVVPRVGGTTDNGILPTDTYKVVTTFKRRLITASDSTVFFSDLNKPESWPLENQVTIPSGGPIVALAAIGTNSEFTTGAEEYLLIFKESELWVITGSTTSDIELKFIAKTGAVNQPSVVSMTGFATWMSFNGIYIWDGSGKPTRVSRPINSLWGTDGDLDKTKLIYSWAVYFEKTNQVIWRVSHRIKGEQKLSIKLDVRLTLPHIAQSIENREADGIFLLDYDTNSYYSGCSYRPTSYDEKFLTGDGSGFVYNMYTAISTAVAFDYETRPLDMGAPDRNKRFKRVLVWAERITPDDLTLMYWSDYKQRTEYQSKQRVPMSPVKGTTPSLWDIAFWDIAYWDDYSPDIGLIEFNLHNNENNVEGVALKLRFEQLDANVPVRIHGYAIEWDDLGPVQIAVPIDS